MPILIKNIDRIEGHIDFTYNIFFEMILFLSLLSQPSDYAHYKWAIKIKKKLPKELVKSIHFWGSFKNWHFFLDILTKHNLLAFKNSSLSLNFISTLNIETVFASLWNKAFSWEKENEKEYRLYESENYEKLLSAPEEKVNKLKDFLIHFFKVYFAPYIQTIELAFLQNINEQLRYLTKHGIEKFFINLSNKHKFKNNTLIIEGWPNKTFSVGNGLDKITLIPNIFCAPHFLSDYERLQNTFFLCYPIRQSPFLKQTDISQEEIEYLAASLRVLGDPVRLKILLSLNHKPACNQELAEEMNISRPAISKHIARLRLFNFISGENIGGNRIQYRVKANRIIELLKQFSFLPDQLSFDFQKQD